MRATDDGRIQGLVAFLHMQEVSYKMQLDRMVSKTGIGFQGIRLGILF